MFCIAAFIVFAIIGIFSARYRVLAKKAWQCVWTKIRFKPCQVGFKEEAKSILLGKLVLRRPALARVLDKWIDVLAFVFVVLSIWSLISVFNSGLNLFVYDTCTPNNAEACALGGEACSVVSGQVGFWDSVKTGKLPHWVKVEAQTFGETVSRIPSRLKTWKAEEYVTDKNTYYQPFDPSKLTALEIIDPSCRFCSKLFVNIKEAGFENKYNLTYLAYPIPNPDDSYRFRHSYLIASYLEAAKLNPLNSSVPADWQILEKLFTGRDKDDVLFQEKFNLMYNDEQAKQVLQGWLEEIGYSPEQITKIVAEAGSDAVSARLAEQTRVVEDQIKTIKIPTIIFDGNRYDRVIGPDKLK